MSDLAPNAFIGKTEPPTDADLDQALGPAKAVWEQLIADLAAEHGVTTWEWKSYSPKTGWALRLKRGKRTIVWLGPCKRSFRVLFILGEKAVSAARQSGLSASAVRMLDTAERYPEGTCIRFQIKGPRYIRTLKKLAEIKLQN